MSGSTAEEYHRLTKYCRESIQQGNQLDLSTQPEQFKDIVSNHRVSLRAYMEQDSRRSPKSADARFLARVGRMLFYTNGVTGVLRCRNGANQLLRASPSAGALYPTEIYVALRDTDGFQAGIYNYQVRSHELVRLWEGDHLAEIARACGDDRVEQAQACLLLTGVFWRSAWRYQERGYRRVLLDTGHVLANLMAYAPHESCTPLPILGFCDSDLNGLLFFDEACEGVLAAVPLLDGEQELEPASLWASPTVERGPLSSTTILSEADLDASLQVALHRASGCGEQCAAPTAPNARPLPSDAVPLNPPAGIDDKIPHAIVQRRSARGYTGETMSSDDLGQAIGFAFGRNGGPRYVTREVGMLNAHLIVHDVAGFEPGIYRVEGRGEALRRLYAGDFRDRIHAASLGQELARGSAAVLVLSAPAGDSVELWGDRAYRHLHLEAGLLGERLQLAASALELGACGIGGFFDDDTAALAGLTADDFVLYLVTFGHT